MTETRTVRCLGMDTRREAVFRMAFKMYKGKSYQLLEMNGNETPDIHIVDIDSMDGREMNDMLQQQKPLPLVLLTGMESQTGPFAFLQKPVRMEALFSMLDKLVSNGPSIDQHKSDSIIHTSIIQENPPVEEETLLVNPENTTNIENKNIVSIERSRQPLTGKTEKSSHDLSLVASKESQPILRTKPVIRPEEIHYFDPNSGILGLFQSVWRDKTISIIMDEKRNPHMYLDPVSDMVSLRLDDVDWQSACQNDGCLWQNRSPQENEQFNGNRQVSFQWALWQVALWTARGRVSRQIPLHAQIRLKSWPNLTRLPETMESLRLSAFLSRSPASPVLVVQMLGVEPFHVFNFIAAADSLGLLHYQKSGDSKNIMVPPPPSVQRPINEEKRGFLGRILKRIVGL